MLTTQTRRRFLSGAAFAGAATVLPARRGRAEPVLETTSVRLSKISGICIAPQYVAEELLRAEGFTEIRYLEMVPGEASTVALARGNIDLSLNFAVPLITVIDAGAPVTVLAGVHVGCYELFAKPDIRSLTELTGKRVAADDPMLFKLIAAQVGLDPVKDIDWVLSTDPAVNRSSCLRKGRSTPSWLFRRTPRNCAPGRSDT